MKINKEEFIKLSEENKNISPFMNFLFGGTGGLLGTAATYPLENVSRMQEREHLNILEALGKAQREKTLFKGVGPKLIKAPLATGIAMGAALTLSQLLDKND